MRWNGIQRALLALACTLVTGTAGAELVIVVSSQSPVTSLTRTELVDIYLGRLTRLPDDGPIVPVDQGTGTPAREEFYREYLGRSPAQIKTHWSKLIFTGRGQPPRSVEGGRAAAQIIAEHPRAIGYVAPQLVGDQLRVVPIE